MVLFGLYFGLIALTLISGLILEKGAVFTLRRWQTEKSYTREPDLKSAIGFLLGRFGREFLGLLVFSYNDPFGW